MWQDAVEEQPPHPSIFTVLISQIPTQLYTTVNYVPKYSLYGYQTSELKSA